jgi:hypothetical protein
MLSKTCKKFSISPLTSTDAETDTYPATESGNTVRVIGFGGVAETLSPFEKWGRNITKLFPLRRSLSPRPVFAFAEIIEIGLHCT